MYFLALVAIVKNEQLYIEEFIHYYRLQGVDHFYFYDNESVPPLKTVLSGYSDICTLIPMPGEQKQLNAFNHYIQHFGKDSQWAAFFDIDEYILPKKQANFRQYLEELPFTADCIGVNWVVFGNGGHVKRPSGGLIIDHYRYSEGKQHKNVKCVVKPAAVKRFTHPHYPDLKFWKSYKNAIGDKMKGAENTVDTRDTLQLNHYFTKSLEEFEHKLQGKRADNGKSRSSDPEEMKWLVGEPARCSVAYEEDICTRYLSRLQASFSPQVS
jgi:hypothetical protein